MISVIIPVYNTDQYLEKCLDSVLSQTYCDLEVLVIDDGATDRSGEICDRYAGIDQRIRVFHTENRGLSAARNLGLDNAHGQYIGFVDSDDWIEADMYENLFSIIEQADADIATCRFYQEYRDRTEESGGTPQQFTVEGSDILRAYLIQQGVCQDSWNNLFKAELFQSIRYPEGRSFEDYCIKPRLLKRAKKMVYTPACLLHYRNRKTSLSNVHSLKSNVDFWLAFRERFDLLSSISEEYYRLALTQAVGAIGRMWRWVGSYSVEEKQMARIWLDEMQQFNDVHFKEIMKDSAYSLHTKFICLCAKSKSSLLFSILCRGTRIYRKFRTNDKDYFA